MWWIFIIQLVLSIANAIIGYHSFERGKKHSAMFSFFVAGFCFMGVIDAIIKIIIKG